MKYGYVHANWMCFLVLVCLLLDLFSVCLLFVWDFFLCFWGGGGGGVHEHYLINLIVITICLIL